MLKNQSIAIRRIIAFMVDWLVILVWGGILFGIAMVVTDGNPGRPKDPWFSQAIGFITMTVPVILYFAILESSKYKATIGKMALGLVVIGVDGSKPTIGKSLVRNSIKFLPWELGHIVANQAVFSGNAGLSPWVYCVMALAFALPVWWISSIFFSNRAPYDRLALTYVVHDEVYGSKFSTK